METTHIQRAQDIVNNALQTAFEEIRTELPENISLVQGPQFQNLNKMPKPTGNTFVPVDEEFSLTIPKIDMKIQLIGLIHFEMTSEERSAPAQQWKYESHWKVTQLSHEKIIKSPKMDCSDLESFVKFFVTRHDEVELNVFGFKQMCHAYIVHKDEEEGEWCECGWKIDEQIANLVSIARDHQKVK